MHLIDSKAVFLLVSKLLHNNDIAATTRYFAFWQEALPLVGQLGGIGR
jgi:hypothetical protein